MRSKLVFQSGSLLLFLPTLTLRDINIGLLVSKYVGLFLSLLSLFKLAFKSGLICSYVV